VSGRIGGAVVTGGLGDQSAPSFGSVSGCAFSGTVAAG